MLVIRRLTPIACLLVGVGMMAQESIGTVRGVVRDKKGTPIANATLRIKGPKLLVPKEVKSNAEGEFRIPLLPPSDYELTASKDGFIASKGIFYLNAGQTRAQNFDLTPVATTGAVVEVIAASSQVDKTETKTATSMSLDTIQNLPTGSLNAYGALSVAPGVTGSTMMPQIRGAAAGQTAFTINGVSSKDPIIREGRQFELVLDDLTEDISVIQSPLNARYGNTAGGIVNLVTKTGGNEFSGSARVKLTNNAWNARFSPLWNRNRSAYFTQGTSTQNDALDRTYEISLTGPIIKDVLTFTYGTKLVPTRAASITLLNIVTPTPFLGLPMAGQTANRYGVGADGSSQVVNGSVKSNFHTGKLFWNITDRHQLVGEGTQTKYGPSLDTRNQPGTTVDPNASFTQSYTSKIYNANYRGIIGEGGVLDVRYGSYENSINFSGGPGIPINTRIWQNNALAMIDQYSALVGGDRSMGYYLAAAYNATPNRVWTEGSTGSVDKEVRGGKTFMANLTWILGDHNIDVGFNQQKYEYFSPQSFGPTNTLYYAPGKTADNKYLAFNFYQSGFFGYSPADQAYFLGNGFSGVQNERRRLMSTGDPQGRVNGVTNSIYINDNWNINDHWSVMGGLRFNNWKLTDRTGERVNTSAIEPRFEVKYDINGDGQRLLSFSYAQFRDEMSLGNVGGAIRTPGNISERAFWNVGTQDFYLIDKTELYKDSNYKPYTYSNGDYSRDIDPNIKPNYREEVTLSFRRGFENGGSFRATGILSRDKGQLYWRGINEIQEMPKVLNGTTYAITPTYFGQVLEEDPHGERTHRGLEFEFTVPLYRDAKQELMFAGNWTVNRDFGRNTYRDNGDGDPAPRFDAYMASQGIGLDVYNPYGELSNSLHNIARAWLTYKVTSRNGVQNVVTLLGSYSSGAPWSLANAYEIPGKGTTFLPANVSGGPSAFTKFHSDRGAFRNPETFSFDLQWNLTVPLSRKIRYTTYVTVSNVFNTVINGNMNVYGFDGKTMPYNNGVGLGYRASTTASNMLAWGLPSRTGTRSVNIDLGLKF